jgi:hypothetical protein
VILVEEAAFESWAASAHENIHNFCVAMLPHVSRVLEYDHELSRSDRA